MNKDVKIANKIHTRKSNPAIHKKDHLHHNKVGFILELKAS